MWTSCWSGDARALSSLFCSPALVLGVSGGLPPAPPAFPGWSGGSCSLCWWGLVSHVYPVFSYSSFGPPASRWAPQQCPVLRCWGRVCLGLYASSCYACWVVLTAPLPLIVEVRVCPVSPTFSYSSGGLPVARRVRLQFLRFRPLSGPPSPPLVSLGVLQCSPRSTTGSLPCEGLYVMMSTPALTPSSERLGLHLSILLCWAGWPYILCCVFSSTELPTSWWVLQLFPVI